MEITNGLYLALAIVVLVLLVALLVTVLYKPKKRLKVVASINPDNNKIIDVEIKNVGQRNLKIAAPYLKFYHGQHSQIYQVKPEMIQCQFPRPLKVNDMFKCKIDLEHYHETLEKRSLNPGHAKVIIKNLVGMKYASHAIDYKF